MSKHALRIALASAAFLLVRSLPLPLPALYGDAAVTLLAGAACLLVFRITADGEETESREAPRGASALPYLLLSAPFALLTLGVGQLCGLIGDLLGLAAPVYEADFLPLLVAGCLAAPLAEEIAFRLAVQRPLESKDPAGAVAVSAVLFAMMHTNAVQIPYALVAGVALGAVAVASRTVWVPVAMHVSANLLSLCLMCAPKHTGLFLLLCGVASVPAVWWLIRSASSRRDLLRSLRPTEETSSVLRTLLSPPVAAVLCVLTLLTVMRHLGA